MFNSIPIELWLEIFFSIVAIIAVLILGSFITDRKWKVSKNVWYSICAVFEQNNIPTREIYTLISSFILAIGIYFFVEYLTNCVSTDLVIAEEPIVIKDYDDIIRRNITGMHTIPLSFYAIPLLHHFAHVLP